MDNELSKELQEKNDFYGHICANGLNVFRQREPAFYLEGFDPNNKGHLCLLEWAYTAILFGDMASEDPNSLLKAVIYVDCSFWTWLKLGKLKHKYKILERGKCKSDKSIKCNVILSSIARYSAETCGLSPRTKVDWDDLYTMYYNY